MVQEYVAAKGARLSNRDADKIGKFLDKKLGDAPRTPEDVVRVAKPASSPLHAHFEWDDRTAADEYRIQQAGYLLRVIEVVAPESGRTTRAYHSVIIETTGKKAYVPARVVWAEPEYAVQVVDRARHELVSWRERYKEYEELAGAVTLVNAALEAVAA
jgi:hypothetical protein